MSKLLKILALLLFVLAAFGVHIGNADIMCFGLASWVGSELV